MKLKSSLEVKEHDRSLERILNYFADYLDAHKHRKTPERFSILEEIYLTDGHFDIDDLYIKLNQKKKRVSRATLYNTIDLLLDAKLIIKHQFDTKYSSYEKNFGVVTHSHFICLNCNEVFEFEDRRLDEIKNEVEKNFSAEVVRYSFNIYGFCKQCIEKRNQKQPAK